MRRIILSIILGAAVVWSGFGQDQPGRRARQDPSSQVVVDLPKFDLDFPGGPPQELVERIRAEIGTLNAIIPTEHKDVVLPAMKMKGIDVKQLFDALAMASQKTIQTETGSMGPGGVQYSERVTSAGFQVTGPITPESVWYFTVIKPLQKPQSKTVRYYQLSRYLIDYKIDDITTAVQAGWKMLGEAETAKLNFHQDTKLLIAVGSPGQLVMIDSVLQELAKGLKMAPEQPQGAAPPISLPQVRQQPL